MFSHLAFSNLLLPQHSRKHLSLKPIDIHIPSLRQLHEALVVVSKVKKIHDLTKLRHQFLNIKLFNYDQS